jgi:methylglutaconyl-CoA hydratase
METIQLQIDGRTARVTLNRPEKRNALNAEMVQELTTVVHDLSKPGACKALIITGAGESFCAGADLAALQEMQQADMAQNLADSEQLAGLFKAMHDFPGVLFGAINGHALAGGCGLVTMCDIVLTHEKAKFGYTETRIGFVPAIVAKYLLEKIGSSQAYRLLLGAEIVSAEAAREIGLVHEVSPVDSFDERLAWWVDHLTHGVSAEALATTKKLIRLVSAMDLNTASQYATRMNAAARMSADCKRGIAAFLDKETIRWT